MRLCFVADPNSVHTRRWVGWFARAGHRLWLVDLFGADVESGLPDGVKVVRCKTSDLPLVPFRRGRSELRDLLERLGPDVLHAHYVRRHAWQAALSGFHPLVVSPWGSDILRTPGRAVRTRLWNRFALRAADMVTVSSERMRHASIRAGARPDRIQLVNHGVDTTLFSPGPADGALAAGLGAEGSTVIVSPRTIAPLYRQELVLDAVATLSTAERRPLLIMSARGADAVYLERLRARATALDMHNHLRILEDVAHDELPGLYRLADVVVSVPESDSFPVTVLEAMACGVPVVASDLPAVRPVLAPLDPVAPELIAPVGDVAATAVAIERALRLTRPERDRLGNAMRAYVERTADYDRNMTRMEDLYRQLAAAQ